MQREFIVSDDDIGSRLDKFLASKMPEFSRSEIQKFSVSRGGATVKFSDKVRLNEMYVVIVPDAKKRPPLLIINRVISTWIFYTKTTI